MTLKKIVKFKNLNFIKAKHELDENELDIECIVKNILSHFEISNACEVKRRFFGN